MTEHGYENIIEHKHPSTRVARRSPNNVSLSMNDEQ